MKKIVFAVGVFALSAFCHASVVSVTFNGYIAAKAEESTFIFAHKTIAELSECELSGLMGGAWINSGIRLVFRGRDVEVYDNGALAYTRQLGEGVLSVKNLSFTRSGHTTVKVDRFFVKTAAE